MYNPNKTDVKVVEGFQGSGALYFNGKNDTDHRVRITTGRDFNFTDTGMTICMWVQPLGVGDSSNLAGTLINYRPTSGPPYVTVKVEFLEYRKFRMTVNNVTGHNPFVDSDESLTYGQWYFYCGVANTTHSYQYVDGVRQASVKSVGKIASKKSSTVYFGAQSTGVGSIPLNGTIDEGRVWSRVLSDSEILSLYHRKTSTIQPYLSRNGPNGQYLSWNASCLLVNGWNGTHVSQIGLCPNPI